MLLLLLVVAALVVVSEAATPRNRKVSIEQSVDSIQLTWPGIAEAPYTIQPSGSLTNESSGLLDTVMGVAVLIDTVERSQIKAA